MITVTNVISSLGSLSDVARLYGLSVNNAISASESFLLKAFLTAGVIRSTGARDVIVLPSNGELLLETFLGQQTSLEIRLANGTRIIFICLVSEAAMLGSVRGLVRCRLRLSSFLWPLSPSRYNCVWQDKIVIKNVELVHPIWASGLFRSANVWRACPKKARR